MSYWVRQFKHNTWLPTRFCKKCNCKVSEHHRHHGRSESPHLPETIDPFYYGKLRSETALPDVSYYEE